MGCVFSKLHFECPRPNPRIFQVWNIDSEGRNVKPGKIEVSEAQLILYQKGDITVRWPLRSLRRYGFDAELFSFECGRRCPTGPGVYAFRCQRAEALFNILQECIQNSGGGPGNISISAIDDQMNLGTNASNGVVVRSAPASGNLANGNADSHRLVAGIDSSGYLEPISGASSHPVQAPQILNIPPHSSQNVSTPHMLNIPPQSSQNVSTPQTLNIPPQVLNIPPQVLNIPPRSSQNVSTPQNSSPGGRVTIRTSGTASGHPSVEWSARPPPNVPTNSNLGSSTRNKHNYVHGVAEHMVPTNAYSSGLSVSRDYANSSSLDHSPRSRTSQGWCDRSGNAYVNSAIAPPPPPTIPPGGFHRAMNCVDMNTNYAKLDDLLKQEQSAKRCKEEEEEEEEEEHCYVNVKPEQRSQKATGNGTSNNYLSDRSVPSVHRYQSSVPLPFSKGSVRPKSRNSRLYVNLESVRAKKSLADIKEAEDSPKMHYAVLDLEQNSKAQSSGGSSTATVSQASTTSVPTVRHSVPCSLSRTREGYAQIDFDRTAALSNSANPCPLNDESIRKTRHNATKPCNNTSC